MTQHDAVVSVIHSLFGVKESKYELNKEERAQVADQLTEMFVKGEIDFSDRAQAKYDTPTKIRKEYVPGLISNWLRRSKELNGGVDYEPKNPGSRKGMRDPEIKNLTLLIKSGTLNEAQIEIAQERIDTRKAELQQERNQIEINYNAIPADLLKVLGIQE